MILKTNFSVLILIILLNASPTYALDYTSPLSDEGASVSEQAPDASVVAALAEAEDDLKGIDCQISSTYEEQWALQDALQEVVVRQAKQMDDRQIFIDAKLANYERELSNKIPNFLIGDTKDRFTDVQERKLDRTATATMERGGTISVVDQVKKAGFLFAKKSAAILDVVDIWSGMVEKVEDVQSLTKRSAEIDRLHQDFRALRDQLNANGALNKSLMEFHVTKYTQWTGRGVTLTRTFYGDKTDCSPNENVFDGTWSTAMPDEEVKASFHVSGNHLTILDPMMMEWHDSQPCKPNNDMLTYNTPTKAQFRFQFICGSGDPGASVIITLQAAGGNVYMAQTSPNCGSEQICDQTDDPEFGFELRRVGN